MFIRVRARAYDCASLQPGWDQGLEQAPVWMEQGEVSPSCRGASRTLIVEECHNHIARPVGPLGDVPVSLADSAGRGLRRM